MKRVLFAALLLSSFAALAEEMYLGIIVAAQTTAVSNVSTAAAFTLSARSKISVQCDADAYVAITQSTTAPTLPGQGVFVASGVLFPTSTPPTPAVIWVYGATAVNCKVWNRRGDE